MSELVTTEYFNRDFKGIWIPKEIWLNKKLNALDKIILAEIDSLDQNENGCFASNEYIADFCQCSSSKVSKSIAKLIDYNLLYVFKFDGRKRYLKSRLSNFISLPSKIYEADYDNLLDINTNNNINNKKEKKEKKETEFDVLINDNFTDKELKQTIYEFIKMRKAIKKPLTTHGLELIINKLKKLSNNSKEQIKILNNSIMNNWQGIFPLKPDEKEKEEVKYYIDERTEEKYYANFL